MRQMCRISVVDQRRSAVDEKAGDSLGHSTEGVVRQLAKHLKGRKSSDYHRKEGSQSRRAFKGVI